MTKKLSGNPDHLGTLDGLRGVAAFAVLMLHVRQILNQSTELPHAYLAVDFFFVLSGFVIAKAYEEKLKTSMTFSRFVKVRLLRLYPLVFIGVLMGFSVLTIRALITHSSMAGEILIATLSSLLFLPTTVLLSVHPQELYPVNPPQWSLFFELAINFIYAPLTRWLSTPRLIAICILSAVALLSVGVLNHGLDLNAIPAFFFAPVRVTFSFSVGVLLFRCRPAWRLGSWGSVMLALLLGTACLTQLFKGCLIYEFIVVALIFPAIVFLGSACQNGFRLNAIWLALGELSYPLYITHQPFLRIIVNSIQIMHLNISSNYVVASCVMVSVLVAFLFLIFWDRPVRAWLTPFVWR